MYRFSGSHLPPPSFQLLTGWQTELHTLRLHATDLTKD